MKISRWRRAAVRWSSKEKVVCTLVQHPAMSMSSGGGGGQEGGVGSSLWTGVICDTGEDTRVNWVVMVIGGRFGGWSS